MPWISAPPGRGPKSAKLDEALGAMSGTRLYVSTGPPVLERNDEFARCGSSAPKGHPARTPRSAEAPTRRWLFRAGLARSQRRLPDVGDGEPRMLACRLRKKSRESGLCWQLEAAPRLKSDTIEAKSDGDRHTEYHHEHAECLPRCEGTR